MLRRLEPEHRVESGQQSSVDRIGIWDTTLACQNGSLKQVHCSAADTVVAVASVWHYCPFLKLCPSEHWAFFL